MNFDHGRQLIVSRLALEERLAVAKEIELRLAAAHRVPDRRDLPLERFGNLIRTVLGVALGVPIAAFSVLAVFVLVNMVLHASF